MNISKKFFQINALLFVFFILASSSSAQNDTTVVNTYDYTIQDGRGKPKALYKKDVPDTLLNGQYKVMRTNSWREDMFLKDNQAHGKNYIYYIDRCAEERNYNNGQLDGKQYTYHSKTNTPYKIETYSIGIQVDTAYSYFEDGSLRALTAYGRNGKRHGKHYSYFPNRAIEHTGTYKNGYCVGTWFKYHSGGNLAKLDRYDKNGFLVYEQTYYRNGQKNIEKHLKQRVYVGKYERFYDDGKRAFLRNYKNGYRRGKQIEIDSRNNFQDEYSINNQRQMHGKYIQRNLEDNYLQVKGEFKKGMRDSKWEYFTPSGEIFRTEIYKKGICVSRTDMPSSDVDSDGNRTNYNESFNYTIADEKQKTEEEQMVEEIPFFLFGE